MGDGEMEPGFFYICTVYLFPVMRGHRVMYMSIVEYTVSKNKKRPLKT
jgi:hypothetical protein